MKEARLGVTKQVWEGAVQRSQAFENEYWLIDNVRDRIDPIVVNVASDDEDDLFLDSDEE